ncbi:MAG: helix-turn-helix domain-containing protein [Gaiellaceae bacterium]
MRSPRTISPAAASSTGTGSSRQKGYTRLVTPGQLLREARRRHGVTQEQLAARARTSQAAISRIEREVVSPSVGTLATLLDLLGEELELASTPIDYGHDRTLNAVNLRFAPADRIRRQAEWSRGFKKIQGAARR